MNDLMLIIWLFEFYQLNIITACLGNFYELKAHNKARRKTSCKGYLKQHKYQKEK